ncbi:hypothetical protein FEE95_21435 [Maribacter algarum]|uniref:Uncharacterized protein n=1 Tax=Maribacter algarum (ex Zhang et al. 2020) TaxID=2578118 RepID=A0A5S3Q5J6_9FLAO|nr:hypothetical protein [Maribacter algarum]TMM51982.1 hypothetical protein FEE95_21435 [Maribacter algarum]
MKRIRLISATFLIGFVSTLQAQFTQLELFSGFEKTNFTLLSSYSINDSNTLSITTLAFFQKFREKENQIFDEVGIQPTLFWNFNETLSVGPSLYYNSFGGFSERLSAKLTLNDSNALFIVIPTIAYSEKKDAGLGEFFIQFQIQKPLNTKVSLWLNGQFLTVWDNFKSHSRSFQQLRVGLSYKGHQFGLGVDYDQYGLKPIHKSSFGLYYRKTF